MRLSIIIVNYNVKYFLEQVLLSVRKAVKNIDAEVFVVDNNSSDDSEEMVATKFKEVTFIANKKNVGFSKANNQAIRKSKGEYVLLLNPDTVVEEDTFEKCLQFMDENPDAGGLGVKMVDGTGTFLPESKRSLPTPLIAFFKMFGLSSLFPKSKLFGKYHLGYLNDDEIHSVEVLAGAFMMMPKRVLDKIGLLDETFFMYGEDIDLSYRITEGGYKNYYFPKTRIIHYKGESTKKGSLNYVKMFYNAMIIFAKKHFSPRKAKMYALVIYIAIFFRAILTVASNFVKSTYLIFIDILLAFAGMYVLQNFWATSVKANPEHFPPTFLMYVVPGYIVVWVLITFFSGGYDKPTKANRIFRGILIGTLVNFAIHGLLPNELRYSRMLILLGAFWTGISMALSRIGYNLFNEGKLAIEVSHQSRIAIAGSEAETERALNLLNQSTTDANFIGYIRVKEPKKKDDQYLGLVTELEDLLEVYNIDEVIFCAKDVSSNTIIDWMTKLGNKVDYKIVPEESFSIIGSNSKNTAGDLYALDINLQIDAPMARRNKRVFDLLMCGLFGSLFLPLFLLSRDKMGFVRNLFLVFFGKKSWVGYEPIGNNGNLNLPKIKKGVLYPKAGLKKKTKLEEVAIKKLNLLYAKDYTVAQDWAIIKRAFRSLGS